MNLLKIFVVCGLLGVTSVANAVESNEFSPLAQNCKGVVVELLSLKRSGPGDVVVEFFMQNTNNDDRATFFYYGGAGGNNTFLIDNQGNEWRKKKVGGNGNIRKALMGGVRTKHSLIFHIEAGGSDVSSFTVVLAPQILPLKGIGSYGFCNLKYPDMALQE